MDKGVVKQQGTPYEIYHHPANLFVADFIGDRFDMNRIRRNTDEGPMCIPLHPGAERCYREEGYL